MECIVCDWFPARFLLGSKIFIVPFSAYELNRSGPWSFKKKKKRSFKSVLIIEMPKVRIHLSIFTQRQKPTTKSTKYTVDLISCPSLKTSFWFGMRIKLKNLAFSVKGIHKCNILVTQYKVVKKNHKILSSSVATNFDAYRHKAVI